MPKTDKEELGLLKARLGQVEGELRQLKAAQSPAPPKPTPPPRWATQGDGHNIGMNYNGEPTACETIARGGSEWIMARRENGDWKDASGIWRNSEGVAIAHPGAFTPRPIGPPHDYRHQLDAQIIDRIVDSFEEKEE
jgi:hypothetical protein